MLGRSVRFVHGRREEIKGLGAPILRILREKQLIESCSLVKEDRKHVYKFRRYVSLELRGVSTGRKVLWAQSLKMSKAHGVLS